MLGLSRKASRPVRTLGRRAGSNPRKSPPAASRPGNPPRSRNHPARIRDETLGTREAGMNIRSLWRLRSVSSGPHIGESRLAVYARTNGFASRRKSSLPLDLVVLCPLIRPGNALQGRDPTEFGDTEGIERFPNPIGQ